MGNNIIKEEDKNYFPESIVMDNKIHGKNESQKVFTLDGNEISFAEDPPLEFSETTSIVDVFNSRLTINLLENS